MKQKISITINSQIVERINNNRGLIPLSTFIEQILIISEPKWRHITGMKKQCLKIGKNQKMKLTRKQKIKQLEARLRQAQLSDHSHTRSLSQ
jgi:hypothetical protein